MQIGAPLVIRGHAATGQVREIHKTSLTFIDGQPDGLLETSNVALAKRLLRMGFRLLRKGNGYHFAIPKNALSFKNQKPKWKGHGKRGKLKKYQQPTKRVDFSAIEKLLDSQAGEMVGALKGELVKVRDGFLANLQDMTISPGYIETVKIDPGQDTDNIIFDHLVETWRQAKNLASKELPPVVREKVARVKALSIKPEDSLEFLKAKSLSIAGIISEDLTRSVKLELLQHLQGDRTLVETITRLKEVFAPFVDFPPYRLENIARTPLTESLNMGRKAIAEAAGGYVTGYEFSAILDGRTTPVCNVADGLFIKANDSRLGALTPPLHFQCRSVLTYVTQDDEKPQWSTDGEIDKAVGLIQSGFK